MNSHVSCHEIPNLYLKEYCCPFPNSVIYIDFATPAKSNFVQKRKFRTQLSKSTINIFSCLHISFFRRFPTTVSTKKKNVGILLLVPTVRGSRIAHTRKIEQREAHAVILLIYYQYTLTQTSTVAFSLTSIQNLRDSELSKENVSKRLSICLSPPTHRKRLTGERQDKSTKNMYWRNKSLDFFENSQLLQRQ